MDQKDFGLHEWTHPCGVSLRVPKGFFLCSGSPDTAMQLCRGDDHFQFPIAVLRDFAAYLDAVSWYEGDAMTPASPDWKRFVELLRGKEGINLEPEWENKKMRARGPMTYHCSCSDRPEDWEWDREENRWPKATAILEKHFPDYDIQDTLAYWMLYGADCDCLVAFNIDSILTTGFSTMIRRMTKKLEK